MRKGLAASIKRAVEGREDAAAGVCVVDGGAKDKAVGLLGGGNELVYHVVIKGASTAKLGALTAADAVADGLGAQLEYLAVDTLGV